MKMKVCLNIIFLLAFAFNSFSQRKEFEFKNLTQENGLPSNESYFVYRDSRNFLWFATDQGVVRYNGNEMEHFNLPDNVVFKIREDSKGRIWFFSHTGKLTYFFNGAIYPFRYNNNIAKTTKNILITDAYVTDNDEIIINSAIGENFKILRSGAIEKTSYTAESLLEKNTFWITQINEKHFFSQATMLRPTQPDTIYIELIVEGLHISYKVPWGAGVSSQYGCITLNGKDIFFFLGRGIARLSPDGSFKTKFFPHEVACITAAENIWVGFMKHGAILLDPDLNEVYTEPVLKDKSITSIRSDYEGGVWFSTLEKGIFYLKNSHINHLFGDSTLAGPVFRLYEHAGNSLLYANTTGIYKLTGNAVSPVLHQNSTKVNDLFIDQSKNIYLTGSPNIEAPDISTFYKRSIDNSFNNVFIFTGYSEMIQPLKNKYLISTYTGFYRFTTGPDFIALKNSNQVISDSRINFSKPGILFHDSKKQVWAGTINALYKFNSTNSSPVQFKPYDTLLQKGVTAMRQMENGIYCIGIRFGGIALMRDSSIIANISETEGLVSNSIKYLLPLKDQLWAATAKGISVIQFKSYDPVKYTITNIGKNDALYNLIIYQLLPYQGNILAATSNGIYQIDHPEQLLESLPKPIPFYINSISYYKGDTGPISSITLPYKYNRVVIKYSAVCFNLPEEIKYYYRSDNTDPNWHEIASTELVMENLIPGTYYLEIKAAISGEQRFSDIQKLQIIVEKPWWQNNWLRITGLILLITVIFIFVKRRINTITSREQQNTALHAKMMELEQIALRSQMNPHFIFNCLTSIQQLVVTGNKYEANEYLVKFARLIRKTLELSGSPYVTIEEETDYLHEYLILEQLRIPGQFEFLITIDPGINKQKTEIPNMMLQPIVENSIRHGIKHLENKKGYITVSLEQKENYIYCTITDNGVGRGKKEETVKDIFSENKSYGMDIVNKRLEAISDGKESLLEVEDLYTTDGTAAGTKVLLRLPYKTR
jgi:ligand-binding sensor domain-containing protein